MEHVDLSTGISWHPVNSSGKRARDGNESTDLNTIFQCAFDKTQAAVNSVLQKANQACIERVMDFFVQRTTATKYPHLLPLQRFPVAALIAGMDAGAASSALWTEPLVHRLKHRFPFVVSIQREFSNGRQMLEHIAHAIFAENQRRDTMEGQWLLLEMRRKDNNLRSRRAYHLKNMKDSDIPSIKWDTAATILNLLEKVVAPLMHFSDDITIQADMLQLELQSIAEESIQEFSSSYANKCECLERLLEDSKDRLRSLRKTVGLSTTSERKLLQLHRWLLQKHHDVVEEALKLETGDSNRESLRKKLGSIAAELSSTSIVSSPVYPS
ncbi:hypothetical protein AC1031_017086 [Aphanomyces cochlioides]|nr:hypothetical protein AC1031_017086 [Aphanomyces cochlioides]